MPELPEVETVKRGLEKLVVDKEFSDVEFDWPKGFPNNKEDVNKFILGAKILTIDRRGKGLIINLDTDHSLLMHLKMTGQVVYRGEKSFGAGHPTDSLVDKLPDKSTRIVFTFSDGSQLFFNDQRKFGWVKLLPTTDIKNDSFITKLGPEPLDPDTKADEFIQRVRRRAGTSIKAAILNQSTIAGIGNIYADEALFIAGIHPETKVKQVDDELLTLLFEAIKLVLKQGIESGGSTDKNYVDAEGKRGSYLSFARVFRREGKPCLQCSEIIIKTRVAGRGTHHCPKCQKASASI